MNILSNVKQVLETLKLNTALSAVADLVVPSLDAEAGAVVCWTSSDRGCVCSNGFRRTDHYSSPSSQCNWGWPVCSGCNYTFRSYDCNAC